MSALPTFFNIFLERIMAGVLEDHKGTVSIGGRTITNLRFADDIDGLAGQEARAGQVGKLLHSFWNVDQCREDPADNKQHQWHQH